LKRDNVNYLVVGVFVLTALVTLLVLLYFITGKGGPRDTYYVVYSHVSGLRVGTPVYFDGYPVGQIDAIRPLHSQEGIRYRVSLSIERGWPIPADSVARMTASGLLAALSINIRQGRSGDLLEPGAEIRGQEGGDFFQVMNRVALDLNDLAQTELKPLLQNLDTQVSMVAREFQARGPAILAGGQELVDRLNATARRVETLLDDDNLALLDATLDNVHRTSANAVEASRTAVAIAERGEAIAADLQGLSGDIHGTRAEVDALIGDLRGVVGENRRNLQHSLEDLRGILAVASRHVERVAYHMEGTSRNMHEFSRQIRQNPGLLLGGRPPTDADAGGGR
jgi:phospholipid/cholesterol/gamma-HCH transport system substrate-binding protein